MFTAKQIIKMKKKITPSHFIVIFYIVLLDISAQKLRLRMLNIKFKSQPQKKLFISAKPNKQLNINKNIYYITSKLLLSIIPMRPTIIIMIDV